MGGRYESEDVGHAVHRNQSESGFLQEAEGVGALHKLVNREAPHRGEAEREHAVVEGCRGVRECAHPKEDEYTEHFVANAQINPRDVEVDDRWGSPHTIGKSPLVTFYAT